VRARLGPGGIWLAGTDQGVVVGGTSLASLTTIFQATAVKSTSALAFASASEFFVGVTNRSGPGESAPRIYRLDCQFGTVPSCTSLEIGGSLPTGEIMSIAVDPLHANTILVAIRGKGVFRGVFTNLVVGGATSAKASASSAGVASVGGRSAALVSPGIIGGFNSWRWSAYSNGLPAGVTGTSLQVDSTGHFLLGTFGRGAFVLFTGVQ
jgi:hypothetical protein